MIVLRLLGLGLLGSALGTAIVGMVKYASATGPGATALAVVLILSLAMFVWRIEDGLERDRRKDVG